MNFTIAPLSQATLAESQDLVFSIFNHPRAPRALAATLDPSITDAYPEMKEWNDRAAWVAQDAAGRVVGVIGLYTCKEDRQECDWLNWYCVAPQARGQGLGRRLLQQAIDGAVARDKKVLRLWTTDAPLEADAQLLYEKMGFAIYKTEPSEGQYSAQNILYRQRLLP